ncbi:MAG: PEP-CTERM system histidine kinase PrsK [Rhodocyclales bacterium GT-UBC]|nr:MAG: PEP-CTERM system histidine kinase PrsK [Rhodocyclales bacterium GT-UBC]
MESLTTSFVAWSFGLSTAGYGLFSIYLLSLGKDWRAAPRSQAMLAAIVSSSLWSIFGLLFAWTGLRGLLFSSTLADLLRYGCWYLFLILLLAQDKENQARSSAVGKWLIAGCGLTILSGFILHLGLASGLLVAEFLGRSLHYQAVAMIILGLILVEQLFRNVTEDSRWNLKPLCLGLTGLFIFDLYLYSDALMFGRIDADAFSVRGVVNVLVTPLLVMSNLRSHDWTTKIRISQKAAFHSASLLGAGTYLLLMSGVGYYIRYFGGDWGRALQLGVLFAALLGLVFLAVSGSMRAKLRVVIGKHFFSYRYDYREEWLRFTRTLSQQDSAHQMGQQVIRGLADMVESPAGSLWLLDGNQSAFYQAARWNMPSVKETEQLNSQLIQFLMASGWVINLEEFRCYPARYGDLLLPEWISSIPNAWLIIPLMVGNEINGFVILAGARTRVDINWEVNDLLRTAGCQGAGFLAKLQATEALLEAKKFDAFNKMSAFVVHDLKNIVTQLSLMLKNAERHRDNPEFQQDMLMTVENSVERMRQLMMQLREGATPPGTPCGVFLPQVIERIQVSKLTQGAALETRIDEQLTTRGHEERLERVIGHLVQNAFDATHGEGKVWVYLRRNGDRAVIEVGDTGEGMAEDFIRDRLFKPFNSTKHAGMGIGAYESAQYIKELGGEIMVKSEQSKGTLITVTLPLFEVRNESDLREREVA